MFKTERMDLILEILHEKKHATIDYLSKHVFASNVTIRRDLKKMEDLGLVIRSYGGVTLMDTENKYVPLIIREQDRSSVKNQIARQAVSLISEGSTIFLDGSSTVLCMVNYLRDEQNITVITNSLRAATRLCEKRIDVYCTGGKLVPEAPGLRRALFGKHDRIHDRRFDVLFLPRAFCRRKNLRFFRKRNLPTASDASACSQAVFSVRQQQAGKIFSIYGLPHL